MQTIQAAKTKLILAGGLAGWGASSLVLERLPLVPNSLSELVLLGAIGVALIKGQEAKRLNP